MASFEEPKFFLVVYDLENGKEVSEEHDYFFLEDAMKSAKRRSKHHFKVEVYDHNRELYCQYMKD